MYDLGVLLVESKNSIRTYDTRLVRRTSPPMEQINLSIM